MRFSFLPGKNTAQAVAIFDVGSSSVGSAIVLVGNGNPEIIYTNRLPIPFIKDLDSEKFTKSLLTTLVDAALDIKTVGTMRLASRHVKHVSEAAVIFASPWCISEGITVRLKKDREFLITKELIDRTVNEESKKYANDREGEKPLLIERHAVGVVLNGYQYDDPYSKKATEAEITAFLSFIPASLEEKTRNVIQGALLGARLHAHSFPMMLFSGARDALPDIHHALLIDIRGEVTDVSVMDNNVLINTVSFPVGERTILRALAKNEGIAEEEYVKLRLHVEGNSNESVSTDMDRRVSEFGSMFEAAFKEALSPLAETKALPQDIIVTIEGGNADLFTSILSHINMGDLILGGGLPKVHLLDRSSFQTGIVMRSEVHFDTYLVMETLFMNKILKMGE